MKLLNYLLYPSSSLAWYIFLYYKWRLRSGLFTYYLIPHFAQWPRQSLADYPLFLFYRGAIRSVYFTGITPHTQQNSFLSFSYFFSESTLNLQFQNPIKQWESPHQTILKVSFGLSKKKISSKPAVRVSVGLERRVTLWGGITIGFEAETQLL